jgi:regulator of replication initiation timing
VCVATEIRSENVDQIKSGVSRVSSEISRDMSPQYHTAPSKRINESQDDKSRDEVENVLPEFQILRKKYDQLVEYTVCVTAERDAIKERLDETEREHSNETIRRKQTHGNESPKIKKADKISERKLMPKVRNYLSLSLSLSLSLPVSLSLSLFLSLSLSLSN